LELFKQKKGIEMDKYMLTVGEFKGALLISDNDNFKAVSDRTGETVFQIKKSDIESFLEIGVVKYLRTELNRARKASEFKHASIENTAAKMARNLDISINNANLEEQQDLYELFRYVQACIDQLAEETRELYNKQR
jgi:hypothetical protein